jgi:hypothetical protein
MLFRQFKTISAFLCLLSVPLFIPITLARLFTSPVFKVTFTTTSAALYNHKIKSFGG